MALDLGSYNERYYADLAAAYCRGALGLAGDTPGVVALERAAAANLRIHRFKRSARLPRVQRVLGILRGLSPTSLLDIGSGRGVFLWPLLTELPNVPITSVDTRADRVAQIEAVRKGGIRRLTAVRADAQELPFPDQHFEVVTALEVLEHVQDPARVAREVLRVTAKSVVASVPSKQDDNPEHLRTFDASTISALFMDAGARRVNVEFVLGHIVAVVSN